MDWRAGTDGAGGVARGCRRWPRGTGPRRSRGLAGEGGGHEWPGDGGGTIGRRGWECEQRELDGEARGRQPSAGRAEEGNP